MRDGFYNGFSEEQVALCEALIARALQWKLPIKRTPGGFLGVGKSHGFYMFWVSQRKGEPLCFRARTTYSRRQERALVCVELRPENEAEIFAAADAIYHSYLACAGVPSDGKKREPMCVGSSLAEQMASLLEGTDAPESESELAVSANVEEALRLSHALLLCLAANVRNERHRIMWERYVLSDRETLQDIAGEYAITRERVRQIVSKVSARHKAYCQRSYWKKAETEVRTYLLKLDAVMQTFDRAALLSYYGGFADDEKRKRSFLTELLLGEAVAEKLAVEGEHLARERKTQKSKDASLLKRLEQLQEWICYPTQIFADTERQVSTFPGKERTAMFESFLKKLEALGDHLTVIPNPNIVYYSSNKTDHRPDFLIQLEDGRRVLVVLSPLINMAYHYNVHRFNELHRYCARNGYGYLITNDRGQSIFKIKAKPIDAAVRDALNAVCRENGAILWQDICELKKQYPLSNETIVAYVLQEKLRFEMDPYFCITARKP